MQRGYADQKGDRIPDMTQQVIRESIQMKHLESMYFWNFPFTSFES